MILPWELGNENTLAEALISKISSIEGNGSIQLLQSIVETLSTKAFRNVRNIWFELSRRAVKPKQLHVATRDTRR